MRIVRFAFAGLLLQLAACAPLSLYYKEDVPVARLDSDLTACRVTARSQVPADMRSRYIPPVYSHRRICNASGSCTYLPILLSPGRYETYDANEGLRRDVVGTCMAGKGYAKVSIPPCDTATARSAPKQATRTLPRLTPQSCAVRFSSGRWRIVSPRPEG